MSRADVDQFILKPMQAVYYPKRDLGEEDQKAALRTYGDVLEAYEADDLKAAWVAVAAKWDKQHWPAPNMILVEARKARIARSPGQRDLTVSRYGLPSQTLMWQRWLDVRSGQLGSDAVTLGVAWALKCAVLYSGVNPQSINLDELRRAKAGAQVVRREIAAGSPIPFSGRFIRFSEDVAAIALRGFVSLDQHEIDTAAEISRALSHRGRELPHPDEPDRFWMKEPDPDENAKGLLP